MLLSCRSISKSIGAHALFEGVNLSLDTGQRLGLIGPNGSGKSTLLRMLAGLDEPDTGEILTKRGLNIAYVPQADRFGEGMGVQQVVAHALTDLIHDEHDRLTRAAITLGKAGFTDMQALPTTLSGGWSKRLAIVQQLARHPEVLLLDEPTNHLDLEGLLWLERLLASAPFSVIVITHDRVFLQKAVNRIVEIAPVYPEGTFEVEGDYAAFLQRREQFLEGQRSTQQTLQARVRLDDRYIAQGAKARTTKRKSHLDAASDRRDELLELQRRNAPVKAAAVEFEATDRRTQKLLAATNISKTLGDRPLFSSLDLTLAPGQCLALAGPNGSGKTTLIRTLTGELTPDTGTLKQATNLRVVLFTQDRAALNLTHTLQQALCPVSDRVFYRGKEIHVISWAKRFLFRKQQLNVPVGDLSGGEQARILIANLMVQPADLLILDEPTNDLDIPSLEVLEESLADFPGAVILVTHDRFMLDRLATDVIGLDGCGGAAHYASLTQWQKAMKASAQTKGVPVEKTAKPKHAPKARTKLSYKTQRELDHMEEAILAAEAQVEQLQAHASDPAVLSDHEKLIAVCSQLDKAHLEVRRLYDRWSELEAMQG